MLINAIGYSGTGSSAIVHLLSEYQNTVTPIPQKYEHVIFYTPHGLFDLEDKLILNNSIHNADAAIDEFYASMKRLNDNDFGWFGNYQKLYGNQFMKLVNDFIEELIEYEISGYWSNDFVYKKSFLAIGKDTLKLLLNKKVYKFGEKLERNGDGIVKYSFIDKDRFYKVAKKFIRGYCEMINPDKRKVLIVDQLLLPHNLYRVPRYFEEEVKCIVFDRDPRDMYVLSKYVWPRMGSPLLFPDDTKSFVDFYTGLHKSEIKITDERILRLHFEDLIYQYDKTVDLIERFIDKEILGEHINKGKIFIPENSIKNTQNFRIKKEWEEEVSYISEKMSDTLYAFPYELTPEIAETTDP